MSMAVKYGMKKRMAKGGDVKKHHPLDNAKGVHTPRAHFGEDDGGVSKAGSQIRRGVGHFAKDEHLRVLNEQKSMRSKDRTNLYDGGDVVDPQKAADAASSMRKAFNYADGGCVSCANGRCMTHGGLVDRVMRKRMSEGGQVANDTDDLADFMPNEFDDLVLRDDLEADYTGANSGDEIGNKTLDDNDQDLVARIMRSRAKKDRLPRPA